MNGLRSALPLTGIVLVTALVHIADILTPTGIEVWVFYLPVILIPVLFNKPRQVVVVSFACSVLVVIGSFASPRGSNPPSWDLANRAIGLMAIWLSAYRGIIVCRRTTGLEDALANLQKETDLRRQAEQTLREHEERLRLATEGAGMGTWDLDLRTGKMIWSEAHFRILGYESVPSGEASHEMWLSRVHPDDRKLVLASQQKAQTERSLHCVEFRICQAEGQSPKWLAVFGRFLYDSEGEAVRFIGVSFDITRRKELENDFLRNEVLRITAREQQQIGQDLHDSVGQELTGLGLMAQTLAQRLPEVAPEKSIANRLIAGFDQVHRKVRELARSLIPVHVETRGLSAALDDLVASAAEQSGISVTSECPDWVELPDHETAAQIFRIAQEAVANALRHGRPRHIRVTLLSEPDGLRLRIKNDGIGVSRQAENNNGLGLRIMAYRARQIGGVLQIDSAEGGGTIVTLTLPRSESHGEKEPGN